MQLLAGEGPSDRPTRLWLGRAPPAGLQGSGIAGLPWSVGWTAFGQAGLPTLAGQPAIVLAGTPVQLGGFWPGRITQASRQLLTLQGPMPGQQAFKLAGTPRPAGMLLAWQGYPGQSACQLLAWHSFLGRLPSQLLAWQGIPGWPAGVFPGRVPLLGWLLAWLGLPGQLGCFWPGWTTQASWLAGFCPGRVPRAGQETFALVGPQGPAGFKCHRDPPFGQLDNFWPSSIPWASWPAFGPAGPCQAPGLLLARLGPWLLPSMSSRPAGRLLAWQGYPGQSACQLLAWHGFVGRLASQLLPGRVSGWPAGFFPGSVPTVGWLLAWPGLPRQLGVFWLGRARLVSQPDIFWPGRVPLAHQPAFWKQGPKGQTSSCLLPWQAPPPAGSLLAWQSYPGQLAGRLWAWKSHVAFNLAGTSCQAFAQLLPWQCPLV